MRSEQSIASSSPPALHLLAKPLGADATAGRSWWIGRTLGPYARHPRDWPAAQVFFATMSVITVLYLALYHPYWVLGGDAEFYLAVARNLARGEGYRYNGQPVGLVPPGWPLILAGGMWLTSNIALLKLLLIGSILIFLGCAFGVLRRYASPWWCAAAVLTAAMLQPTWQLSMWFFSDGPFLATSWLALLLAMKARERHLEGAGGPALWARIAVVLALLALAVCIRWSGILWCPIVALAFLDRRPLGSFWPRRIDVMWIAAALSIVIALTTFFALRQALKVDPAEIDPRYGAFEASGYDLVNAEGDPTFSTYTSRLLAGPQWLGVVWWNLAARTRPFREVMFFIAALTVIPLACAGVVGLKRRQWLWLGAAMAWLPVILTWPHAIDRYTMPVTPFLALGTMLGTAWMVRALDQPIAGRWRYGLTIGGLIGLLWGALWVVGDSAWTLAYNLAPRVIGGLLGRIDAAMHLPETVLSAPLIAVALLVVLGVLLLFAVHSAGREHLAQTVPCRLPLVLRRLPLLLVAPAASVLITYNLAAYGLEVWVARDSPTRSEAGSQRALNAIGHFLRQNDERLFPGELAVAPVRALNGVRFETLGPRRNVVWVADRNAIDVPYELAREPPATPGVGPEQTLNPELVDWLRQRNVRWYIVMPMQSRFVHFDRPLWRPRRDPRPDWDWRLYEITPQGAQRMEMRAEPGEVLLVPGLEDARDAPKPASHSKAGSQREPGPTRTK